MLTGSTRNKWGKTVCREKKCFNQLCGSQVTTQTQDSKNHKGKDKTALKLNSLKNARYKKLQLERGTTRLKKHRHSERTARRLAHKLTQYIHTGDRGNRPQVGTNWHKSRLTLNRDYGSKTEHDTGEAEDYQSKTGSSTLRHVGLIQGLERNTHEDTQLDVGRQKHAHSRQSWKTERES